MYAGQQKHVSRAMVEAWCNAAKANASPAAMHKLLQVHLCCAHVMVVVTVHSAVALAVRCRPVRAWPVITLVMAACIDMSTYTISTLMCHKFGW